MTDWDALIRAELDPKSADLGDPAVASLCKYLQLLSKWTAVTNLVATGTDPRSLVVHHVGDCLALLPHLRDATSLIDVGSGGGLPGAVLAIARPALSVTALEPVHKKHAFLAAIRRELRLASFKPLAERDEQHRAGPDFRPYDVAVSRAAFALPDWLQRGARLIRPGGRVLGMEARERSDLPPGARRHPYHLDGRARAIIEWQP